MQKRSTSQISGEIADCLYQQPCKDRYTSQKKKVRPDHTLGEFVRTVLVDLPVIVISYTLFNAKLDSALFSLLRLSGYRTAGGVPSTTTANKRVLMESFFLLSFWISSYQACGKSYRNSAETSVSHKEEIFQGES